jgi:hypothetical protein
MLMCHEYRDQPPPDDAIEFHVWVEANECDKCFGTGCDLDIEYDDDEEPFDCPHCDGTGYTEAARPYV